MKIIKKGNKKEENENKFYKGKCSICHSEFIFNNSDINSINERCINGKQINFVVCPECRTSINISENNIEDISETEYFELFNE